VKAIDWNELGRLRPSLPLRIWRPISDIAALVDEKYRNIQAIYLPKLSIIPLGVEQSSSKVRPLVLEQTITCLFVRRRQGGSHTPILAVDVSDGNVTYQSEKEKLFRRARIGYLCIPAWREDARKISFLPKSVLAQSEKPREIAASPPQWKAASALTSLLGKKFALFPEISLDQVVHLSNWESLVPDYEREWTNHFGPWKGRTPNPRFLNFDGVICTSPPYALPLVAFEYDGRHHEKLKQKRKDFLKEMICARLGIQFIRIRHDRSRDAAMDVLEEIPKILIRRLIASRWFFEISMAWLKATAVSRSSALEKRSELAHLEETVRKAYLTALQYEVSKVTENANDSDGVPLWYKYQARPETQALYGRLDDEDVVVEGDQTSRLEKVSGEKSLFIDERLSLIGKSEGTTHVPTIIVEWENVNGTYTWRARLDVSMTSIRSKDIRPRTLLEESINITNLYAPKPVAEVEYSLATIIPRKVGQIRQGLHKKWVAAIWTGGTDSDKAVAVAQWSLATPGWAPYAMKRGWGAAIARAIIALDKHLASLPGSDIERARVRRQAVKMIETYLQDMERRMSE
jgi:hypothetical protein